MTEFAPAAGYTIVTVSALRALQVAGRRLPADVRFLRVGITLGVSLAVALAFLHVPPFMAAGADLNSSTQRDYAANIWQEAQTSLALVALVLPWMVYALLWPGAAWGRRILLAVSTTAVVLTTWLALLSAQSYSALPAQVSGTVDAIQGRVISLHGQSRYYLVLSDDQLEAAQTWLKPGAAVTLWVSPRGHVGAATRADLGS